VGDYAFHAKDRISLTMVRIAVLCERNFKRLYLTVALLPSFLSSTSLCSAHGFEITHQLLSTASFSCHDGVYAQTCRFPISSSTW